jgi:hypothetical protein
LIKRDFNWLAGIETLQTVKEGASECGEIREHEAFHQVESLLSFSIDMMDGKDNQ